MREGSVILFPSSVPALKNYSVISPLTSDLNPALWYIMVSCKLVPLRDSPVHPTGLFVFHVPTLHWQQLYVWCVLRAGKGTPPC